jgi:hypothetical protein
MRQRWLPEFGYPDVNEPALDQIAPDRGDQVAELLSTVVRPGQCELFTAERELVGRIEAALTSGRFEDARAFRDALLAIEGPSAHTRDFGALDTIGDAGFWNRPLPVVLSDWQTLSQQLVAPPNLRKSIWEGGLSRLLERHAAIEIVRAAPPMLPGLTNRLCVMLAGDEGAIPIEAARLVRDALLEGLDPGPGEFANSRIVDLLAEDHRPVWLACLGALRHLWPVPPGDPSELLEPTDADSEAEDERGCQFWACLRRTVSSGHDDPAAVAARTRMKRLHPDMHAQFMRHGVRRE